MDQNWYAQDFAPKPPKPKSYVWVWVLGICVTFFGLMAAVVLLIWVKLPAGNDLGDWLAKAASTDNSQVVEFRMSQASQRLQAANAAYTERQTAIADVPAEELEAVESFLLELTTILQSGDDSAFENKISLPEFKDRVRKAPSISFAARREFRSQFDEWYETYSPYSVGISRIQLASVKRDPSDNTLIVYTWVFHSIYPDRVAWYLRNNGQQLRIVDYEILDTSMLESDEQARQFSAAFTGIYWDNYLEVHEFSDTDTTTPEEVADKKAELQRISKLTFPKSVAHTAYYRLALIAWNMDENDLCLEMLARAEELAILPAIYWQRATVFQELKDYVKAEASLKQYTDLIGPGPECFMLEAELATVQKQYAKANKAWLNVMAIDPETSSLPWTFHQNMPSAFGARIAAAIQDRSDNAVAAQKLATMLIARDRFDLAEPLLPIAESGGEPTAELYGLRAKVAELNGNDDEYLKNIELAWTSVNADHPSRSGWIYEWSSKLMSMNRATEAIQRSPDPGGTYYDYVIDEDGQPTLSAKRLQELSDAMQTATADGDEAVSRLELWRRLAPIVVFVKQHQHAQVWESLSELLATDAVEGDKHLVELLTESEELWIVHTWLVSAAIQADHVAEVWDILPEEGRLSSLLWDIEEQKSAHAVNVILELLRSEDPDSVEVIYCDALSAKLKDEIPAAIAKYHEFMKHPDSDESDFVYSARNSLVEFALIASDWKPVVAGLPNETLLKNFASKLVQQRRIDDAMAVVEMAKQQGATLSDTVGTEAEIYHAEKDWPVLCALCDQWLAERDPENDSLQSGYYSFGDPVSHCVDAWLATGQPDRAKLFLAENPSPYALATNRLKIAVTENDQAAAEAAYAEAETKNESAPRIMQLGEFGKAIWSEAWRDFRRRHPVSSYSIVDSSVPVSKAVLLQSDVTGMSVEQLQTFLKSLQVDVKIDDLTETLKESEQRFATRLTNTNRGVKETPVVSAGLRQIFRIHLKEATCLVICGSDSYDKPAGIVSDRHEESTTEDLQLSEPLRQAIDEHKSWISLILEGNIPDANNDDLQSLFAQVVAALINEKTTVINLDSQSLLITAEVRTELTAGKTKELPGAESFSITGSDPLSTAFGNDSDARLRKLRARLDEISEGEEMPNIILTIVAPSLWGRDQLLMECSLQNWQPRGYPSTFTVDLGDSPFVPAAFRREFVETNSWSIKDWREK